MLRCADEFSCERGATRTLESAAHPCRLATVPTVSATRPTIFAYIVAFAPVKCPSGGRAELTCTTRAASPHGFLHALPRRVSPDTFPRAPDRPHSPGRRDARADRLRARRSRRPPGRRDRRRASRGGVQAVRAGSLLRAERARPARDRHDRRAVLPRAYPRVAAVARRSAPRIVRGGRPRLRPVRHELVGGGRAVSLSLSGATCFWCARACPRRIRAGARRRARMAGVVGAITALLQTYGLRIDAFSLNRAPGGTFGNRNFMAHLCVIVFPALLLSALRAESPRAFGWGPQRWRGRGSARTVAQPRGVAGTDRLRRRAALLRLFAARRARGMVRWRRLPLLLVIAAGGVGPRCSSRTRSTGRATRRISRRREAS